MTDKGKNENEKQMKEINTLYNDIIALIWFGIGMIIVFCIVIIHY